MHLNTGCRESELFYSFPQKSVNFCESFAVLFTRPCSVSAQYRFAWETGLWTSNARPGWRGINGQRCDGTFRATCGDFTRQQPPPVLHGVTLVSGTRDTPASPLNGTSTIGPVGATHPAIRPLYISPGHSYATSTSQP